MAEKSAERTYDPAEIEARLKRDLPAWRLAEGSIRRTYKTSGWKSTLMVVNAIGHLAETAWHHPDLLVSYPSVTVRLSTHDAGGVTEKDFALARAIEEFVTWRPAPDSALEGAPANAAYLRQD